MWFTTFFIQPLYNVFVFLIGVMPGGNVGLAIIVMTLLVRLIFYPAFTSSIRTQMGMAAIQGDLDEINEKYKDDPTEKAKQTMALYKERNIRPLAGLVAVIAPIPIFIALYYSISREGLPHIETNLLYSFVHAPATVNIIFLGFLNLLTPHNIGLALVVALLQYAVVRLTVLRTNRSNTKPLSPEKAQAQAMQQNLMLYALPVVFGFIVYSLPAVAGVYFAATNVISIGQELIIRHQMGLKV
ncbi:MAG TPA: YidC/Oxa1 family membrane protein insertase [Candidatus Paceibacterota bacterium]|nr:YidC/Oxa1 family membrane protein insertase [Candidatus Paceibacterota bacterium]